MLSGEIPFEIYDKTCKAFEAVNEGYDIESPPWDTISDSAKNLVRSMLTVKP